MCRARNHLQEQHPAIEEHDGATDGRDAPEGRPPGLARDARPKIPASGPSNRFTDLRRQS